jgi:hypothetical protein
MSTHRALTPMLLVLCTLTACTATPPRTATGTGTASRVYVTGSAIAVPGDSVAGRPGLNPALQVVTEDQIMLTGQRELGAAVRQLVPSLQ